MEKSESCSVGTQCKQIEWNRVELPGLFPISHQVSLCSLSTSRQNAELAKLRQDCVRLNRDLGERTEALQADDEHRKCLEAKVAASVEQLAQFKVSGVGWSCPPPNLHCTQETYNLSFDPTTMEDNSWARGVALHSSCFILFCWKGKKVCIVWFKSWECKTSWECNNSASWFGPKMKTLALVNSVHMHLCTSGPVVDNMRTWVSINLGLRSVSFF